MRPLDDHLLLGSHRRADLHEAGVTARELRGPLWQRTAHGQYAWLQPSRGTRASASTPLPDAGGRSEWSPAGRPRGCTVPASSTAKHSTATVYCRSGVCTSPRHRLVTATNDPSALQVSRSALDPDDLTEVDGVPCTSLVRAAFDAARFADDVTEAVVALDCLLRSTDLDLGDVQDYAAERRRWRGRPQVVRACSLTDGRALSCQETRLRVLWCELARLPTPKVNATVVDAAGVVLAMADLLDEDAWLVTEYDGAYHAGAAQRGRDDARTQRLHGAGLHVVRVVSTDLHASRRAQTAARLRTLRSRRIAEVRGRRRAWSVLARPAE
jgi:hypothetical protein